MAADIQIGCYLRPAEAKALDAYARSLGLSRPKLCALLILRAIRSGQLASLRAMHGKSEPKARATRVTTRLDDDSLKEEFIRVAANLGLGSDDAAAKIFRAEIDARWLEKALSQ